MITEEHVVSFFDQANPIPDVELLDMEQIGAARHLVTLEQRSSEVTRLDTKTQDHREKSKKNVMAFLVAAAVVIVAGIGFMVLTRGDEVLGAEDLVGIWASDSSDFIAQFNRTAHTP